MLQPIVFSSSMAWFLISPLIRFLHRYQWAAVLTPWRSKQTVIQLCHLFYRCGAGSAEETEGGKLQLSYCTYLSLDVATMCSAEDGCLSVGSFPSYWGWERSGRPDGLRARGQILISAQRTVLSVSEGETEVKACPPERGRVCAEGWETPRSPCEHRTRHLMGSTVHKQHTYTHTHSHTGRPSISVT